VRRKLAQRKLLCGLRKGDLIFTKFHIHRGLLGPS